MDENWMLGVGHYDSFDRGWVLCRGITGIPYEAITPKDMDEAIETCIKKNKGFNPNDPFNDHYGVIRYKLEEHGLIDRCIEVWCPYDHKRSFSEFDTSSEGGGRMIVETIDPILEQVLLNHVVTHESGASWEISTSRFPYAYEFGYEQVMLRNVLFQVPGHYETMIFKREGGKRVSAVDYGHMRYENEEEARRHHNLILELICNNKIHPKESEMNDVNTWVSPWIERELRRRR